VTESTQEIVRNVKIRAYPEQIWEAWMDTDRLTHWLVDQASGWPGIGSTLSLTWDRLLCTIDYQVAEVKPCERLLWRTRMPAGFQNLSVQFRREGPSTVVELREQAPDDAPDPDESASGSSWQLALATLKYYLENYSGHGRHSFFSIKKADFSDDQLLSYYTTATGLEAWLAERVEQFPAAGQTGPYRLVDRHGKIMSGQLLTFSRNEALFSWTEIDGFLELKCFSLGPGQQAICLRGSTYTLGAQKATDLEGQLGESLSILSGILCTAEVS
jgi:uncharacterized protein YndB with AHSA1/START domain